MNKLLGLLTLFPALAFAAPFNIENIAPGVYVHRGEHKDLSGHYGGDICNTSFIIGSKGVAVIDTGGSPAVGAQLRKEIRKVTQLPILYVITTHVHPDHALGSAAFKQDKPVFVGHGKLAHEMALRTEVYLRNQTEWVGKDAAGSELIPPDLAVDSTHDLDLGDRTLHLTAHPVAHSPSDLSVQDSATAILWTGDLLSIERTPSVDGNLAAWLEVIETLRNVNAPHIVPGHGPVTANGGKALDDEKRYLAALLGDVRAAIERGDSMEATIETAAQSEKDKWLLFDITNRRNIARVFPMLEWE
ncbi:MAG: quinoprotein relay system zinc metallohydrolase 2 [Gammaproteobacteria bacterium]|nr:quinoprotein relay system zinc metallohydrolase 2 [Gammaproteobacteria bacterium]MBU1624415.1 quinoprotein relay system zinc metallohydrolase 2 [Gammaproteobacteria bacterium]MBU1981143.1 quinoprotein relay system zinc metallohydrolase 2 [Gammaproteobacteria bacterium]